jgi:hypothetical protein
VGSRLRDGLDHQLGGKTIEMWQGGQNLLQESTLSLSDSIAVLLYGKCRQYLSRLTQGAIQAQEPKIRLTQVISQVIVCWAD